MAAWQTRCPSNSNGMPSAGKKQIPCFFCENVNEAAFLEKLQGFNADLIFCAAYPQIFKRGLLNLCSRGAYNSHPSLLPRCRGAHPVFWALASGEKITGVTIHLMTENIDQGDIIHQIPMPILDSDHYIDLYGKLVDLVPPLISHFFDHITDSQFKVVPQNHDHASYFRDDRKEDHKIIWEQFNARKIFDLVRACPMGAFFEVAGEIITVFRTEIIECDDSIAPIMPGTVFAVSQGKPIIATREGLVKLTELNASRKGKSHFKVGTTLNPNRRA